MQPGIKPVTSSQYETCSTNYTTTVNYIIIVAPIVVDNDSGCYWSYLFLISASLLSYQSIRYYLV